MFFAADSIGRHLSSTVLAELESGLASDINKLVIEDIEMSHQHKTAGKKRNFCKNFRNVQARLFRIFVDYNSLS